MPTLKQRIEAYYQANPTARPSTSEAVAEFGSTPHHIRESMLRLRRMGLPIRCTRVYELRNRSAR